MYQKPYTSIEINVLLHFSDLRTLILQYNNVRWPTLPEMQKHFSLTEWSQSDILYYYHQRWSPRGRPWPRGRPRGHIVKSLALTLASKVKSLASRPQILENWPVLGSRTALFFELLKFCGVLEKFFGKGFFVEIAWKISVKTFFFGEHLHLCPWSFALASSIPVLGLESVCPRKGCPWPWPRSLALASSPVSSTPPLTIINQGGVIETSLASSTHFEVLGLEGQVLGLGLEASNPWKLPCPRLEDSTFLNSWNFVGKRQKGRNLAEILRIPFLFSFIGA